MGENKQRMYVSTSIVITVVMLSLACNVNGNYDLSPGPSSEGNTNGDYDLAPGPASMEGLLPSPLSCAKDTLKIPDCIKAVKTFRFKEINKECCVVLLGISENCFGNLFPMKSVYHMMLKAECKLIGILH